MCDGGFPNQIRFTHNVLSNAHAKFPSTKDITEFTPERCPAISQIECAGLQRNSNDLASIPVGDHVPRSSVLDSFPFMCDLVVLVLGDGLPGCVWVECESCGDMEADFSSSIWGAAVECGVDGVRCSIAKMPRNWGMSYGRIVE